MLKQFFVRVDRIILDKPVSGTCKVFVQGLPHGDGALAELEGGQELYTKTQWNFCYTNPQEFTLNLHLIQESNNSAYTIGKLVLPLTWFQPDSVVVETYPLTSTTGLPTPFFAQLSVHVDQHNSIPFRAPQGRLLVIPAWKPAYFPQPIYGQQIPPPPPQNYNGPVPQYPPPPQNYPQPPYYPQNQPPPPQQQQQQPKHSQTHTKTKHKSKKNKNQQEQSKQNDNVDSSTGELLNIIEADQQPQQQTQQQQENQQNIVEQPKQTPGEQAKEILQNYNHEQEQIKQNQIQMQQQQQQLRQQQMQMQQQNQAYQYPSMQYPSSPSMNQQVYQNPPQPQYTPNQIPPQQAPQPQIKQQQPQKQPEVYIPPSIPSNKPAPPPIAPPPKTLKNSTPEPPKKPDNQLVQDMPQPQQVLSQPNPQQIPQNMLSKKEEQQTGIVQNPISIFDENFLPEYPDE